MSLQRRTETMKALIVVSATRQKNVRQKNKRCHFSVLHFSVWLVLVAETTIKATMKIDRIYRISQDSTPFEKS